MDQQQQKIYTTSCAGREPDDLRALLERLGAVLIDVRLNPQEATRLVWTRPYLELLIKKRYLHVPLLADRAAKSAMSTAATEESPATKHKPSIQNLQLGMRVVKALQIDAVIMCDCASAENCHRHLIAQAFEKENFEVRELSEWNLEETRSA